MRSKGKIGKKEESKFRWIINLHAGIAQVVFVAIFGYLAFPKVQARCAQLSIELDCTQVYILLGILLILGLINLFFAYILLLNKLKKERIYCLARIFAIITGFASVLIVFRLLRLSLGVFR